MSAASTTFGTSIIIHVNHQLDNESIKQRTGGLNQVFEKGLKKIKKLERDKWSKQYGSDPNRLTKRHNVPRLEKIPG